MLYTLYCSFVYLGNLWQIRITQVNLHSFKYGSNNESANELKVKTKQTKQKDQNKIKELPRLKWKRNWLWFKCKWNEANIQICIDQKRLLTIVFYTDISCLGEVFAKNTSRETKNFPSRMAREIYSQDWYFSQNTPPKHDISV